MYKILLLSQCHSLLKNDVILKEISDISEKLATSVFLLFENWWQEVP
jgi:hypothetical protein